ncbi:MAG: hypothetical protein ACOCVM_00465 [Desulfovibrionaceae bacterium]
MTELAKPLKKTALLSDEKRLEAYLRKLSALKERKSLREVVEREVLLEFITLNHTRINEFPLLTTQQQSIINLLTHRSKEHPGYEFIQKIIGNFLVLLNHYGKALSTEDNESRERLLVPLLNTEKLLIKLVQGVVYGAALMTDNFEEIVIRYFGGGAIETFNEVVERYEVGVAFWREMLERFVSSQITAAYDEIIEQERYAITSEQKRIVIRFAFDDVLGRLQSSSQEIEKTRVQSAFERNQSDPEQQETVKLVFEMLHSSQNYLERKDAPADKVRFVAHIACIDPVTKEYRGKVRERMDKGQEVAPMENPDLQSEREEAGYKFLVEQVLALAFGSAISVDIIISDFLRVVRDHHACDMHTLRAYVDHFGIDSLRKTFFYLLESAFQDHLRSKAEEWGGKVQVAVARRRRSPAAEVNALAEVGLNRIRKSRIWESDPSDPAWLLFRARAAKELVETAKTMQIEEQLLRRTIQLWESAPFKVEFWLIINLQLIARATKNIKGKVSEILSEFGVLKNSEPNSG